MNRENKRTSPFGTGGEWPYPRLPVHSHLLCTAATAADLRTPMPFRKTIMITRLLLLVTTTADIASGQTPVRLTLDEAKTLALNNHPQVLAVQNAAEYTNQQVVVARAPYFPTISADITSTGGNSQARIGAGALSATRLFNR